MNGERVPSSKVGNKAEFQGGEKGMGACVDIRDADRRLIDRDNHQWMLKGFFAGFGLRVVFDICVGFVFAYES